MGFRIHWIIQCYWLPQKEYPLAFPILEAASILSVGSVYQTFSLLGRCIILSWLLTGRIMSHFPGCVLYELNQPCCCCAFGNAHINIYIKHWYQCFSQGAVFTAPILSLKKKSGAQPLTPALMRGSVGQEENPSTAACWQRPLLSGSLKKSWKGWR